MQKHIICVYWHRRYSGKMLYLKIAKLILNILYLLMKRTC